MIPGSGEIDASMNVVKFRKKIAFRGFFLESMSVTILTKPENEALGMYKTIGI